VSVVADGSGNVFRDSGRPIFATLGPSMALTLSFIADTENLRHAAQFISLLPTKTIMKLGDYYISCNLLNIHFDRNVSNKKFLFVVIISMFTC
jgi:hypothetical protein